MGAEQSVGGGEARGRIRGVEGEKKRGGGGEKEGWSRVIKFLNSHERPEQGD